MSPDILVNLSESCARLDISQVLPALEIYLRDSPVQPCVKGLKLLEPDTLRYETQLCPFLAM